MEGVIVIYGRWIVLGGVGLMAVIEFIGFSTHVYDWISVLFMAALTNIEIKKFLRNKQMFRLSIVIPSIIGIIFAIPFHNFHRDFCLSRAGNTSSGTTV